MMNLKRILVLNGSCRYQGSTQFFLESLFNNLDSKEYKVQYLFCRDFNKMRLNPNTLYDISYTQRNGDSKIYELEEMILKSDCFVVASPVYMHNISSDLKLILEKLSTWSHTLRLDGKPCLVLSTCNSNGNTTVTGYLCRLCHNKQLINSHFYRGVSELPYKLLFAVIYTHLEFRYEVSHT
ncbi:hypothetical protein EGO58_11250, partial [Limosilactobacillus reuteri]